MTDSDAVVPLSGIPPLKSGETFLVKLVTSLDIDGYTEGVEVSGAEYSRGNEAWTSAGGKAQVTCIGFGDTHLARQPDGTFNPVEDSCDSCGWMRREPAE